MVRQAIFLLAIAGLWAFKGQVNAVSIWSRKPGLHSDGRDPGRVRPISLAIDELKLVQRKVFDLQYGRQMHYRGLPLSRLFAQYKKSSHDDLALLKFENGMQIAVPLDFEAFVALEVCEPKSQCSKEFPAIAKDDSFTFKDDPRPISFSWNKIAVSKSEQGFSPWRHADSLVGIEFVNAAAYDRQFDVNEPTAYDHFKERCASCHGVRQVGATFGWDVVGAIPLFEKRSREQLLHHVKYPKAQAKEMGLMMPAQKDITTGEIDEIWILFRKLAQKPLKAYSP